MFAQHEEETPLTTKDCGVGMEVRACSFTAHIVIFTGRYGAHRLIWGSALEPQHVHAAL
jgi:hypothetical protein